MGRTEAIGTAVERRTGTDADAERLRPDDVFHRQQLEQRSARRTHPRRRSMTGFGESGDDEKNGRFLVTYTVPQMHVGIGPERTDASSGTSSIGVGGCSPCEP